VIYNVTGASVKSYTTLLQNQYETEKAGLQLVTSLWQTYSDTVIKVTGTTLEQQYSAIETWSSQQEIAITAAARSMEQKGQDSTQFVKEAYTALAYAVTAKYQEVTDSIGGSTQAVRDNTRQALQEIADEAYAKFQEATTHAGEWSDATIAAARDAYTAAQAAVDSWGTDAVSQISRVSAAQDGLNEKVQTYIGGLKSVTTLQIPGGKAGTPEEQAALADVMKIVSASNIGRLVQMGTTDVGIMNQYQEMIDSLMAQRGFGAGAVGIQAPGFAEGGIVTVGENGPERVALPYGSVVVPGTGDTAVTHTTQVVLDGHVIGQAVDRYTIRNAMQNRKFQ
jgi:hypothetical protein